MRTTLVAASFVVLARALNVSFSNCLADSVVSPRFQPSLVSATWNSTSQTLSYAVYGNVTGQINDTNAANTLASALTNTVSVAGYTESKTNLRLCDLTRDPLLISNATRCPIEPGLALLEFETALNASYIFASITSEIRINGPTETNFEVGCFRLTITPPFSNAINDILTYIPLIILLLIGIKVIFVTVANPWSGTIDPYRGFSNFGMDINALRMLTPGFSDCLAYLQFVAYSSMLSLSYPGFFQLVTSRVAWAMLMFDNSPATTPLDYTPQSSTSIATYINFVGSRIQDAWKSFIVWWLILQACTVALVLVVLLIWWLLTPSSTDLTRKNLPFLGGCMLRVYYWLLLPMSALTSYQLITAQQSVAALTALSALVLMLLVLIFPIALIWVLPRYQPRQDLYEDLALLNLFGPLYNTFTEHAIITFVPNVILAILRGLTVGLLHEYGTAQISLLLVFEVVNLIVLGYMRPWPRSTNTTILNLLLISFRLVILILMITFVPSLSVGGGPREWIGYIILIIHAVVLVLGFLGNALLGLLELAIRLFVIVPQDDSAKAIFGARQLRSRRGRKQISDDSEQQPPQTEHSANSLSGLLDHKEDSPFFRAPRNPSRVSSRPEIEMSVGDLRSVQDSDGYVSPFGRDLSYTSPTDKNNSHIIRQMSYTSTEMLETTTSRPLTASSSRRESTYDMYDLSLAPTEDAARRGVDYAVREADVYHPQSSGELLGPSKKLGTGPADPNGIKFRKFNWAPWKREKNEEKGKFVVVRSTPAPMRTPSSTMQETSSSFIGPSPSPISPRYETLEEEDEDDEEEEGQDAADSRARQEGPRPRDYFRARKVVNETIPSLPPLDIPSSFNDIGPISGGSDPRSLLSPFAATGAEGHHRQLSNNSDFSEGSVMLPEPVRPSTGERVSSYHSARTEGSVRSSLVRHSYRTQGIDLEGETAELVDLDLEK